MLFVALIYIPVVEPRAIAAVNRQVFGCEDPMMHLAETAHADVHPQLGYQRHLL